MFEVLIILVIIILVYEFGSIGKELSKLQYTLNHQNLAGIGEELKKIYKIMGGDLKFREIEKKELADLRERFIKQLDVLQPNLTKEQIDKKVYNTIDKYDPEEFATYHFLSIDRWIASSKEYVKDRNKYSHLLDRARRFVSKKPKYFTTKDFEKELQLENIGGSMWLLEELEKEGVVKRVQEYDRNGSLLSIKNWQVK